VSPYDVPGLVAEVFAAWMLALALLVAGGASLRRALVRRSPEKGRVARGLLAAAGVAAAVAAAIFALAEVLPAGGKRGLDAAAPFLAFAAIVLGGIRALRIARRLRRDAGMPDL
jgi:hypothetical protein